MECNAAPKEEALVEEPIASPVELPSDPASEAPNKPQPTVAPQPKVCYSTFYWAKLDSCILRVFNTIQNPNPKP